jgi:acyl-CoA reductase-like NAD-dependent aldehyde dehydrogenase
MTQFRSVWLAGERFAGSGAQIEVRSPFDSSLVGVVPECTAADVDRAVRVAHGALGTPLPAWRRAEILDRAAATISERAEEFAVIIASEAAKPLQTSRVEVDRAASTFRFAAVQARSLVGEVVPLDASPPGAGKVGFTQRVPIGVVGAISPFNFPLNLVAHKVAPAIAAGCPLVLKPASQTPLSAVALVDLLIDDCGLPAEMLHLVTGGGSTVGNALVDHPNVAMITFTGSPEVGWQIRSRAPRKRVGLELGNNSPVIIHGDADPAVAAAKIRMAGFSHAGQSCISTQRIYVQRNVADAFVAALVAEVDTLVIGDPLDETTEVSSLISTAERTRVADWITEAVAGGARILIGGQVNDRGILLPTVLTDVRDDMKVCAGEVFGPVVTVAVYDTIHEAIERANDTVFGLQAAIFTADLATAMHAASALDFGGVLVNEVPTWRADQQPYGGMRESGNTREGPAYAVHEMTEIKFIVLPFG